MLFSFVPPITTPSTLSARRHMPLPRRKCKTGSPYLPTIVQTMSETPRIRDLLRLLGWRVEPFAILLVAFFSVFCLNILVHGDPPYLSTAALLYAAGWHFLLALFLTLTLELTYATVRAVGSLFQRTGRLWLYSVPALSVFFLIVEPLFSSGDILQTILHGSGMMSSVYLTVLMFLSVAVFLLLVFLPVFHGLNAAFLLASILLSRLLLLPLQHLFFPQPADLSLQPFLSFVAISFALASLLYLYLQTRRRTALSPYYERFTPGPAWFLAMLPVLLLSGVGFLFIKTGMRIFHPLLDVFYLNLTASISIALLFLFAVLRWESSKKAALRLPELTFLSVLVLLFATTLSLLVRTYEPEHVFFARKTPAGRFLDLISVLADRDRDGNSFWPGQDPDDANPGIRRESKGEANQSLTLKPSGVPGVDRILITAVIDGAVPHNPVYAIQQDDSTGAEPGLQKSAPKELQFWMQPSNRPERSLRALLRGLSSFEEARGFERRTILSYAAEDGYRTLCFGMDDGSDYFTHEHPARLDSGCQVFEPLPVPETDNLQDCMHRSLQTAETLIQKYREKHTFVWIHLDTRRCPQEPSLSATEQRDTVLQVFEDLHSPSRDYPFLSDPRRRMLGVALETGYLPYFYVSAQDEFWRASSGAILYSQILSGHLFFLRWYFVDMLEKGPQSEDGPATVLRRAEKEFQRNGAGDLNGWVFLHEAPDEDVRWFRDVLGIQGVQRLPALLLYYDARRRRLIYSHGMWNRTIEFRSDRPYTEAAEP